jgi:hypothetical protein
MSGYTERQNSKNIEDEIWNQLLEAKGLTNTFGENVTSANNGKFDLEIKEKMNSDNFFQKTLFHSRLPIYMFSNFGVQNNRKTSYNSIKNKKPLPQELVGFERWSYFYGAKKLHVKQLKENDKNQLDELNEFNFDDDGDIEMENDLPFTLLHTTIMIYHNSISVNNGPSVPISCPILSATVIEGKDDLNDDTLVLLLQTGTILLLRFENLNNLSIDSHIPQVTPYVVDYVSQSINLFTIKDRISYKFSVSSSQDMLFLTTYNGLVFVYNIKYDKNGIPSLSHSHNFKSGTIIDQCILKLTSEKDAFLTLELENSILKLECIRDFDSFDTCTQIMKTNFSIPLFVISLSSTQCILFLQEKTFTIKSYLFCITGEDLDLMNYSYPTRDSDLIINSYYIPKSRIWVESLNNHPSNMFTCDQVLISTSNDASVYLLNIFFDKVRHKYSYEFSRLFKHHRILSSFSLEPQNNKDNFFTLTYYNEMGDFESQQISIMDENGKSISQVDTQIWSEINHYPVFDFEIITSPSFKNSIENYQQELWVLAGIGSHHSLMNLKQGYVSYEEKVSGSTISGITSIYNSSAESCYWLVGFKKISLVNITDRMNQVLEIPCMGTLLHISTYEEIDILITSHQIIFVKNSTIIYQFELPYEAILATQRENKIAFIYENEFSKIIELAMISFDNVFQFTDMELEGLQFELSKVSMLQLIEIAHVSYLVVGDIYGHIYFYDTTFNALKFVDKFYITMDEQNLLEISESFIPYKLHELKYSKNFLVTSKNGYYTILKIEDSANVWKLQSIPPIHLSDNGDLEIIETENEDIVYLKCKYLWKLDLSQSILPHRILMNGLKDIPVTSAISFKLTEKYESNKALMIKAGELFKIQISNTPSIIKKFKTFGIPTMKLSYLPSVNLFAMLPIPNKIPETPLIIFVEHKTLKMLKIETDLNTLFKNNETAICVFEWTIPNGDKYHTITIVGSKTKDGKGLIRFFKLTKVNSTLQLKVIYTILHEDYPITNISEFTSPLNSSSQLIYSAGPNIHSLQYNIETKKFDASEVIFRGSSSIKKFELGFDNSCTISIIYENKKGIVVTYDDFFNGSSKVTTFEEYCSDLLVLKHNKIIHANYNSNSVTITDDININKHIDIGYIPRLGSVSAYPPWLSISERLEKDNEQFITVGLNGQIDLIVHENDNIKNKGFYRRLCELQEEGDCTFTINDFMSKPKMEQLDCLDTFSSPRYDTDAGFEFMGCDKFVNSVRF